MFTLLWSLTGKMSDIPLPWKFFGLNCKKIIFPWKKKTKGYCTFRRYLQRKVEDRPVWESCLSAYLWSSISAYVRSLTDFPQISHEGLTKIFQKSWIISLYGSIIHVLSRGTNVQLHMSHKTLHWFCWNLIREIPKRCQAMSTFGHFEPY
jgi:hypothetical protein